MVWCSVLKPVNRYGKVLYCVVWDGIAKYGMCNSLVCYGIAWFVMGMVCYGYGMVCWSLWAGEDNARQPESFGGKFAPGCSRPFAPRCCGRCTALLYMQPCSLSRRHWWGWSHLWFSRLDFMLDANWRLVLLSYQYQSTFHQFYAFNFRYYCRDDFLHKYGWFLEIIQKLCRFLMLQVGPCPFDHDF